MNTSTAYPRQRSALLPLARSAAALLTLSLCTSTALADGLEFRPAAGGEWSQAFALDTAVEMRVHGLMAEVSVRQRYTNSSAEWLEGRYLLPLPDLAAVGRLRMQVGGRVIEGEVQEKAAAAAAYRQAAAEGRTASLVERERANLFRTRVANIGPGETVEIEIGYWQAVGWQDGAFRLALPLTFVPPYSGGGSDAPAGLDRGPQAPAADPSAVDLGLAAAPGFRIGVDLDAGVELAEVSSSTHQLSVRSEGRSRRIELAAGEAASDRDFELVWRPQPSAVPQQAVFVEQQGDTQYALINVIPPTLPVPTVPRELILVIDNSGSMHGESMTQAKAAVDRALSRLKPGDRFNVIRFDHSYDSVFPQPVEASPAQITQARAFVQALAADGGTEMLAPLVEAFAMPATASHLRQVVLITDGAITDEAQLLNHIEHGRGDARLFAVGIGSAPNAHVLRRAAEVGRGAVVMIRNAEDLAERTDALLAKLDQPALRDLKTLWPTGAEAYPSQLPDLYVGEPLQLLARLPQGGAELQVDGLSPQMPWRAKLSLDPAKVSSAEGVARLWASARIAELEDQLRGGVDEASIREAVLKLALQHQLSSRYTSLVAVDRTPRRPLDADLASVQFANADPAGAMEFAATATPTELKLRLALLLAVLAGLLAVWNREGPPGRARLALEHA